MMFITPVKTLKDGETAISKNARKDKNNVCKEIKRRAQSCEHDTSAVSS